nr:putative cyclase family protein [Tanacetum cinerariifolium]
MFPLTILLTTTLIITSISNDAYPTTTTSCDLNINNPTPIRKETYDNGQIIDISHRYHPDMPSWDSDNGVGEIIRLPKSMKNGSLANNSEMKMETHTGTHVDAPGHVFDRYFDLGFDVDTLDLYLLNGEL